MEVRILPSAMKQSSDKVTNQLGMSIGTATHRLRKQVMFDLLSKLKQNTCIRCNAAIETADELSIDHKVPWRGKDTQLFWNLDNIGFSHKRCNLPHNRSGSRKNTPDGMSWCNQCKQMKELNMFSLDNKRWNKASSYCKECKNEVEKLRKRRAKNSNT